MTKKEAFKAGFLLKFAEMGVTPDEMVELVKTSGVLSQGAQGLWSGAKSAIGATGKLGILALLGIPTVVGMTGGMIASKASGPDDTDVALTRKKLKLFRYQQMLNEVNQRRAMNRVGRSRGESMF